MKHVHDVLFPNDPTGEDWTVNTQSHRQAQQKYQNEMNSMLLKIARGHKK